MAARGRAVRLGERLEQPLELSRGDPRPAVNDVDAERGLLGTDPGGVAAQRDGALVGELDRVADEVDQHLAKSFGIADHAGGCRRRHDARELDALARRLRGEHVDDVGEELGQVERRAVELELAGLDLRDVEDVVDDAQESACRGAGDVDEAPLAIVESGAPEQLQHAGHAVERCADLVAHVGEELALGVARRGRRVPLDPQALVGLAFADVDDRAEHGGRGAVAPRHPAQVDLHVGRAPVERAGERELDVAGDPVRLEGAQHLHVLRPVEPFELGEPATGLLDQIGLRDEAEQDGGGRVGLHDPPVAGELHDALVRVLEDEAELGGLLELTVGLLARLDLEPHPLEHAVVLLGDLPRLAVRLDRDGVLEVPVLLLRPQAAEQVDQIARGVVLGDVQTPLLRLGVDPQRQHPIERVEQQVAAAEGPEGDHRRAEGLDGELLERRVPVRVARAVAEHRDQDRAEGAGDRVGGPDPDRVVDSSPLEQLRGERAGSGGQHAGEDRVDGLEQVAAGRHADQARHAAVQRCADARLAADEPDQGERASPRRRPRRASC